MLEHEGVLLQDAIPYSLREHVDHECLRRPIQTLQTRDSMIRMWTPDKLRSRAVKKVAMKNVRLDDT